MLAGRRGGDGRRRGVQFGIPVVCLSPPVVVTLAVLCLLALLSSFLSAAVAAHVGLTYAYPARFVVESIPFLALIAAGVFAARAGTRQARVPIGMTRAVRIAVVVACLTLLRADGGISAVGRLQPSVVYPASAGVGLAA